MASGADGEERRSAGTGQALAAYQAGGAKTVEARERLFAAKLGGDGVFKDKKVLWRPAAREELRESGDGGVPRRACAQHHDGSRNAGFVSCQLKLRGKGQSLLKIYLCNKALFLLYSMMKKQFLTVLCWRQ